MNVRWLWFDHVPEALNLSRQERRNLRNAIRTDTPLPLRTQFIAFFVGLPVVMAWFFLYVRFASAFPLVFNCLTLWLGIWICISGVNHLLSRRHTYRALVRVGYDVCLNCGYWLRGLGEDVKHCPECGARRTPPSLDPEPEP
jgi:hypothetical protein